MEIATTPACSLAAVGNREQGGRGKRDVKKASRQHLLMVLRGGGAMGGGSNLGSSQRRTLFCSHVCPAPGGRKTVRGVNVVKVV